MSIGFIKSMAKQTKQEKPQESKPTLGMTVKSLFDKYPEVCFSILGAIVIIGFFVSIAHVSPKETCVCVKVSK